MRDIPIFIASSIVEFKDERKELIEHLWTLNKLYKPRGVRLEWDNPEDMSHEVFPDGTQSEIDKAICDSDFFFVIVGRDMGQYTLGEFETAWARRKERGKPKVYAYFLPPAGQLPKQSVLDFRNRLEGLKHYHETCGSMAEVKLEMQIELFRNIDFGGAREASSKEETAQKGQDAARELVREQLDKIAQLKAQGVSPEIIAKMTDTYEEIRRLVQTYKVESDALLDYMGFLRRQHLYDAGIAIGHWLESYYSIENSDDYALSRLKNRLGICYHESNQYEQAERYYRETMEINRRLAEKDSTYLRNVEAICNNLAVLLCSMNHVEEAECYYREALEIRLRLANDNPTAYLSDVAATYNNLGNLLRNTNRMEDAEGYYREALEIRRRLANDNPTAYLPNVATICNNLGNLLSNTNRMKEAECYYQEALKIRRHLAKDNPAAYLPHVAQTYYNLGLFEDKRENYDAARRYFEEALSLHEKFPYLAKYAQMCRDRLANNLELCVGKRKNNGAAKRYFEEALPLHEKFPHLAQWAQKCRDALAKL